MKPIAFIILLFTLLTADGLSQTYENLVFEGAGIRGLAYAGVVHELEQQGLRPQFKRVGGTSAGAITALLFALGYSGEEMEMIITNTKFHKLNDGKWFFIGGINRMNRRFGWYRGEAFSKYIGDLIEAKTGNEDITFLEMKHNGYPEVHVTGTCLNKQALTIFNYKTYPNMKVRDALRVSMSIPLYFEAVFLDSEGTVINHPKHPEDFDLFIDGGLTGNFPIWMFDSQDDASGESIPNPLTLGIRIDSAAQIDSDASERALVSQEITSFSDYIGALYIYVNENLNRHPLSQIHWNNTISVSSGNIGPKIRKLSLKEKELLFMNGKQAVSNYYMH